MYSIRWACGRLCNGQYHRPVNGKGALSSTRGSVVVRSFLYMFDQVCTLVDVMYCMEEVLGMVRYFSSVR